MVPNKTIAWDEGKRPPLVLLENVIGFLTSNKGKDLESALTALNQLGYCCDVVALNAADFTPQSRLRLFVIAKYGNAQAYIAPVAASKLRPEALSEFINSHPQLKWNIRRLPQTSPSSGPLESILEYLDEDDPRWWPPHRARYFLDQLSPAHLRTAKQMISQNRHSYGTAFRRMRKNRSMAELRVDGLAGCLRPHEVVAVARYCLRRDAVLTKSDC